MVYNLIIMKTQNTTGTIPSNRDSFSAVLGNYHFKKKDFYYSVRILFTFNIYYQYRVGWSKSDYLWWISNQQYKRFSTCIKCKRLGMEEAICNWKISCNNLFS